MSSQDFNILRIEAMEKRIKELEQSKLLYALMLFNLDSLPVDDEMYSTAEQLLLEQRKEKAIEKEKVRSHYVDSLDAMDYTEEE